VTPSLVSRLSFCASEKGEIDRVRAHATRRVKKFPFRVYFFLILQIALYPFLLPSRAFPPCFAKFPNTISKKLKSGLPHSTDTAVSSMKKATKFVSLLDLQTKWSTNSQVQWNTMTVALLLSDVPIFSDAIDYRCFVGDCGGES